MATAMPVSGIKPPNPLVFDNNITANWKLFKQKWSNYSVITNLNKQNNEYQVALLLHTIGDEALKIYNSFNFKTPDSNRTVAEIIKKFDDFAIGEINETYERFVFNSRNQQDNENFDTFLSAINNLSKTCNFCDDCKNSRIRDRVVLGIKNKNTQNDLLKISKLTLEECVNICRAAEHASVQGKVLQPDLINAIKQRRPPYIRKCKF